MSRLKEQMQEIREFETWAAIAPIRGVIHRCIGQEACAVGVLANREEGDYVFSNHRSHGHAIAYGIPAIWLAGELLEGDGGSQHLHYDNFYSGGVQAGFTATACGVALSNRMKRTKGVVFCFIGDGTLGEGLLYESLNLASLYNLPVLFVLENNEWAMSTRKKDAVAGSVAVRAKAFGIKTKTVKADNVNRVYRKAKKAVRYVREGKPYFLVLNTYRLCPHGRSDEIRPTEEVERAVRKDPLRK